MDSPGQDPLDAALVAALLSLHHLGANDDLAILEGLAISKRYASTRRAHQAVPAVNEARERHEPGLRARTTPRAQLLAIAGPPPRPERYDAIAFASVMVASTRPTNWDELVRHLAESERLYQATRRRAIERGAFAPTSLRAKIFASDLLDHLVPISVYFMCMSWAYLGITLLGAALGF